jgi:hypothetical protein
MEQAMNDREYLDVCRYRAGLPPVATPLEEVRRLAGATTYEYLVKKLVVFMPLFRLMENRLIMGGLRYGPVDEPGKVRYDRVASIIRRINLYAKDGNQEHLLDVANEALVEFLCPSVDVPVHFTAMDEHNHRTEVKK